MLRSGRLMIRSFVELLRSDLGVDPKNVLTMQVALPLEKYPKFETRIDFFNQLINRIEALPGVSRAGAVGNLPMGGSHYGKSVERIGQTLFPMGKRPNLNNAPITPGYLEAIGTRLVKGRDFTAQDRSDSPRVALVDEAFVREFLPGQDPIGESFKESGGPTIQIVGVTATVMNDDFDDKQEAHIYTPYAQNVARNVPGSSRRFRTFPVTAAVRGEVSALDKTVPSTTSRRWSKSSMTHVAQTAGYGHDVDLRVACAGACGLGIYAVMSYSVISGHRVGIRMALGAQPADIFKRLSRKD